MSERPAQPSCHQAVPVTPAELAADAARCAALGVAAVHVHPRDAAGVESLRPAVIADALTAIRTARPGLPVGVSTGAWIPGSSTILAGRARSWRGPSPTRSRVRAEGSLVSHVGCLRDSTPALNRHDIPVEAAASPRLSPGVRPGISME
ncbi:3-keto-5-aminohexanoate cleavage protein [Micromonospora orduensis]|uniref:3-keto-5-aminohexanoate cleavage protein n=1 Tax=Micromonospora orduensis TaxID=1420891 RepID=UPI001FCA8072|nr:3-keto-5-aminohexanoate cleavage protein [Micromonospora orduensis]